MKAGGDALYTTELDFWVIIEGALEIQPFYFKNLLLEAAIVPVKCVIQ
jgi:hypothetical protein